MLSRLPLSTRRSSPGARHQASEDIGLANPHALTTAVSAYQATQLLGMPECDCILAQVVVMLAESPKSVRTYKAYGKAKKLVEEEEAWPVPVHIRNAPTGLMKSLGVCLTPAEKLAMVR